MKSLLNFVSLSLVFGFQLVVNASPAPVNLSRRYGNYVLHEKRDFVSYGANGPTISRRLEGHIHVPLQIALKQKNLDTLPEHLQSVSDPDSPSYGQHWTHQQVVDAFAPSPDTEITVRGWLIDAGFDNSAIKLSYNKAWIEVEGATTRHVEQLLDTEYHVFTHDREEHVGMSTYISAGWKAVKTYLLLLASLACHNYSLPVGVAKHVDFVMPTVQPRIKLTTGVKPPSKGGLHPRFEGRTVNPRSTVVSPFSVGQNGSLVGCDTSVTPGCLKTIYNMTYTPKATDKNSFGISKYFGALKRPESNCLVTVSYFSNTYLQSDLDTFFGNFSPALVGKSPLLVSINGGSIDLDPASDVGEDGWILEYAMSLAAPQPVQFLQVNNPQIGKQFDPIVLLWGSNP